MNQTKYIIQQNKFQYCDKHSNRKIEYVCLKFKCCQTFFCNECFRGQVHFDHLEKIWQIDEIIDSDYIDDLTETFFQFECIDEAQIIERIRQLKENIIKQLDSIQKSLISKVANFKQTFDQAKDIVQQFQQNIQQFCLSEQSKSEVEQKVEDYIQIAKETQQKSNQLVVQEKEFTTIEQQILDKVKSLEDYVILAKIVTLPQLNPIIQKNDQILLQYQENQLNVFGFYNKKNELINHKFKFYLETNKNYCININIYKNQNYEPMLKIFDPITNFTYEIKFNSLLQENLASIRFEQMLTQWITIQQPIDKQILLPNKFSLSKEKNEFIVRICLQKQQIILTDVESNTSYQLLIKCPINSADKQGGFFTFNIQKQEIKEQFEGQQLQILDITKIYYY